MTWLLSLAGSKGFKWVAIGVFGLLVVGVIALRVFQAGGAAARLEIATETLVKAIRANQARANVDLSPKGEESDSYNRDRR